MAGGQRSLRWHWRAEQLIDTYERSGLPLEEKLNNDIRCADPGLRRVFAALFDVIGD